MGWVDPSVAVGGDANDGARELALLEAVLQLSPDAALAVDEQGTIRAVNDQAGRLFGYPPEELEGAPVEMLMPEDLRRVHAAQRARFGRAPRLRPMGAGLDLYGRRKDGWQFPIDISLAPLPVEGLPALVVAAIRDISELRERERLAARLAVLVRSADVAILSTDVLRVIDSWNPAAERLLGYSEREIVGRRVDVLIPDDLRTEAAETYAQAAAGQRLALLDTARLRRDGDRVEVGLTVSAIRDHRGRLLGFSEMLRDLTQWRRSQAELAAAHAERRVLTERERIAHELHEVVIGRIFAAGLGLHTVAAAVTHPQLSHRLQDVISELDTAVQEIRSSIFTFSRPV